jgi:hypothetical protein
VVDPILVEQVRCGEYVVDAEAVAAAVLRRWRGDGSAVLEAAEPLEPVAVGADEDQPRARGDLA